MNKELEAVERLFLSNEFSKIRSYSANFDLFKMMGIRSKELIHSNILAALLNPSYVHGLNYSFLNSFTLGIVNLHLESGSPLPLSVLISSTDQNVRVYRELENIDLVIEYPASKLVIAIENKIWANEQSEQVARYQDIILTRYPNHKLALVYLSPNGRKPTTLNRNSRVPVYCMSYGQVASQLELVKSRGNESAEYFISQFISHIEAYMTGSNEVNELCWQIFNKHEDAYAKITGAYQYCQRRKVEESFLGIESRIKTDAAFSKISSEIEVIKTVKESSKYVVAYDLDVRLKSWPQGVMVKLYKHNWLGVFPYVSGELRESAKYISQKLGCYPNMQVKAWQDKYYVSSNFNLDKERMVNSDGNSISKEDVNTVLNKLSAHIEEINSALQ
ncbi:PD-(D/E)XK nuclease family protein [Vibrio lentus]|uniref:PDDEXK-like family protein n=1 Tax=Vibrio lentus TaxID=136468 RepID=UPI001E2E86F0|nr:PD-(D/E)XK nuclease family protein [Vibrio lentus]MCC4784488.1 PD-(D/E)XK nuclease family protein [Vibrio lentus]